MARPIRETPLLTGEDANRFTQEMKRVEQMPLSERRQNRQNLERTCREFIHSIKICL